MIETMTIAECCDRMRDLGIHIGNRALADGIESGIFPFGEVISKPDQRRRNFLIYTARFNEWAESLGAKPYELS